jgi:anion-transporting  ArsA/GET3 family ATPase
MMHGQRLHLVSGKGGVGKTTVATALALAYAQAGTRVLLVELNGRDRVAALLKAEPVGYQLREVVDNLFVVDVNAREAMQEYILLTLRFETLYRALFANRLVDSFLRLLPALGELTMLGKVWYHAQQTTRGKPRFGAIVVDAPATGHARALFAAPKAVAASVPPGPMRTNADNLHAMLTDATHTTLHVVTTPEAMPIAEALELYEAAEAQGMATGPTVINQLLPPLPAEALAALAHLETDGDASGAYRALARRARRRQQGLAQLQRLPEAVRQQAVHLPLLPDPTMTLATVQKLAEAFAPWVHAAAVPSAKSMTPMAPGAL